MQMWKSDIYMEMLVGFEHEGVEFWVIYMHASIDVRERQRQ